MTILFQGVGRVRIEPRPNITVDVFVTHTAASDYNYWYRQIQVDYFLDQLHFLRAVGWFPRFSISVLNKDDNIHKSEALKR